MRQKPWERFCALSLLELAAAYHLRAMEDADGQSKTPFIKGASDPSRCFGRLEGTSSSALLVRSIPSTTVHGLSSLKNEDRKKEHKKRSRNWTRMETLKLIGARQEFDDRFRKSGRKADLWDEIAHVLRGPNFARSAQQCKDKWEKLTMGYKEVIEGVREKEDHPFYEELHALLSWKPYPRCNASIEYDRVEMGVSGEQGNPSVECEESAKDSPKKSWEECISSADLHVVQKLLETIITRQQTFLKSMVDTIEQKERMREQIRHEEEEKWRSEERAERFLFHNAMVVLTQSLLGEQLPRSVRTAVVPVAITACKFTTPTRSDLFSPKKRSKNWRKNEVLHLIQLRREMEDKFLKSTRRAGLWKEMAQRLASLGIMRDGKQCREKWDKLVAEYKEVMDGRKEKEESPYFAELTTVFRKVNPNIHTLQESEEIPRT